MKFVYISSSEYPHPTANGVQVVKQCNAFSRIIGEVLLLARSAHGSSCSTDDIRASYQLGDSVQLVLMRFSNRIPPLLKSLIYPIWAAIKTPFGTDCVYGRHLLSLFMVALLRNPKAILFECHAPPRGYLKYVLKLLPVFPSFMGVVVISDSLKKIILHQYPGLEAQKVVVAHDGCDPQPSIDFDSWVMSVGYVGGIYQGRGLDLIVELASRFQDIDFHIVGGDVAQLRDVTGMVIPSNVICHGRVSQAQLADYYHKFSVALAPYAYAVSTPDGTDTSAYMSPLKIFEYMGWGKVVLASDLPVLREVLTHGENSLLCAPDDIDGWEKALRVVRDDSTRKKYSMRAYQDASGRFSWSHRAHLLLSIINFSS